MGTQQVEIADLEVRLNERGRWRNEVVVPTAEGTTVYVGEAIDLYFDGLDMSDIRGGARLSRYDRREGTRNQIKLIQWLPPRFQTQQVPFVRERRIWTVDSGTHNLEYFLKDGRLRTGYDDNTDYRAALNETAIKQGVVVSHQLLDMVFRPIDSKIMKMYMLGKKTERLG